MYQVSFLSQRSLTSKQRMNLFTRSPNEPVKQSLTGIRQTKIRVFYVSVARVG